MRTCHWLFLCIKVKYQQASLFQDFHSSLYQQILFLEGYWVNLQLRVLSWSHLFWKGMYFFTCFCIYHQPSSMLGPEKAKTEVQGSVLRNLTSGRGHKCLKRMVKSLRYYSRNIHRVNQAPTHPPTHPSIHPSIHTYIRLSIHPFIYPFIRPFIHPHIHTYIQPSIYPSIRPSIHPFIHPTSKGVKSMALKSVFLHLDPGPATHFLYDLSSWGCWDE